MTQVLHLSHLSLLIVTVFKSELGWGEDERMLATRLSLPGLSYCSYVILICWAHVTHELRFRCWIQD